MAKKIKSAISDALVTKTAAKRPESKGISKKPATKFNEFHLSHTKPKFHGRRTLLEDLFKTNEKEKNATLHKRQRHLFKSGSKSSTKNKIAEGNRDLTSVCRRLFFK